MVGRLEGFTAAIAEDHPPAGGELVALGVAAEVVVVFQDQDACLGMFLAVEPGGGQPAQATADDHQVVVFADGQRVGVEDFFLPAHLVCQFEGADVAAAQAGEGGWVVAAVRGGLEQLQRGHSGGNADGDAVEEVAAGDFHVQSLVVF